MAKVKAYSKTLQFIWRPCKRIDNNQVHYYQLYFILREFSLSDIDNLLTSFSRGIVGFPLIYCIYTFSSGINEVSNTEFIYEIRKAL